MRPNYSVKSTYIGAGNQKVYSFNFKIIDKSQLYIVVRDNDDELIFATTGDDTVNIPQVLFNDSGGTIELQNNLAIDWKLAIFFADDQPIQPQNYSNGTKLNLKQIENSLDRLTGPQQKLFYWLMNRVPKISDKWLGNFTSDIEEPFANGVLGFNETGTAFKAYAPGEFEGPPGPQGNPIFLGSGDPNTKTFKRELNDDDSYINVDDAEIWTYDATDSQWVATGEYFPTGSVNIVGFSKRYNQAVEFHTAQEAFEFIYDLGYAPQTITSFTSVGSTTLKEKGQSVVPGQLVAVIKMNSNPIASVAFYKDGVQIHNVPSPSPSGGTESYTDSTPITDTTTFRVDTRDTVVNGAGNTLVQASLTYNYVFAYYAGSDEPDLDGTGIAALSKTVNTPNQNQVVNYNLDIGEVPYFAYPASLNALQQITDENGFDVTSGFTERTVNVTNTYGETTSYRVYERNAPAGASSSTFYTFRRQP